MLKLILCFQLVVFQTTIVLAETKGLLPEVKMGNNEEENEQKTLSSEIMITRAENKAIESLQNLIKKQKNAPETADLLYRLAELYMRRSKSGRFFDLNKNNKVLKLSPFPVPNESGAEAVRRASAIYTKIEKEYPHFNQMDAVYFNNAFANQQLGKIKDSQELYAKLIAKFPQSSLMADATLAYGELLYEQQKFELALEQFNRVEKFPNSKVYTYGVYKAAWTYYNLRQTDAGVKKLLEVVQKNPALQEGQVAENRHNLRREALRDLTIFIGDVYPAKDLYSFFKKVTEGDELGQAMIDLAKLYDSHSRQKEMNIFLEEYINGQNNGMAVVKSHLLLIEANEMLKLRSKVIEHLEAAANLCRKDSAWRVGQKQDTQIESCEEGFKKASLEIAAKWWEIWLKNKNNAEFSALTEKAFKIILDSEDPQYPDSKSRFAYAELLFQQKKYEAASNEYKQVGQTTKDKKLAHDADYAALFSKEKSIEQAKDDLKQKELKALALNYIAKYPSGEYSRMVYFKLAHMDYEETHYDEALKRLTPLASGKTNDEFKNKSEDLILDIMNLKKDYAGLQKISKQIKEHTTDPTRLENLNKIYNEARFAEIQEAAKSGSKEIAAAQFAQFADETTDNKLNAEARWQALSLNYDQGRICEAAEISLKYYSQFKNDKKSIDALKDAAQSFSDCGDLAKSASTLVLIASIDKSKSNQNLEQAADLYIIDKQYAEARKTYNELLKQADKSAYERIYGKILNSYKANENDKELELVENKIISLAIEPYATQLLIKKAKKLYEADKFTSAFDLALKINGRNSAQEIRAPARLLQAQILEKELVTQSMKAREDKFAMVLSLKTEKLDKSQTAYLSTLKMSQDPQLQIEALKGMDRTYTNYIDSLENMSLPSSLSEDEKTALKTELNKILTPIKEKKKENSEKLAAAAKAQNLLVKQSLTQLAPDKTYEPEFNYPAASQFKMLFLDSKKTRLADIEKEAKEQVKVKATRNQGLYNLSLLAESQNKTDKALWLVEKVLKAEPENNFALYHKARLLYQSENMASAKPFFDKVLDMKIESTEFKIYAALKTFTEKNYLAAINILTALKKEDLYNNKVGSLLAESYAQAGETDKALAAVKEQLAQHSNSVELWLEQARILEQFKGEPQLALSSYEKALQYSPKSELSEWLTKKVNFLKK